MKKVLSFLFSGWVLAIIGLLALSLVIWIVGPLVAIGSWRPLESVWSRLILIGLIVGIYALVKVIGVIRAKKANQNVVNQLLAPAPKGADAEPEAPEVKLLRERFEKGMETLKNARFEAHKGVWSGLKARAGKRYLYELPWYVIIGSPGSGKTTALRMLAGLEPLDGGRVEIGMGAGWWTEEHVQFGLPFPPTADRFAMLEEQLEIVHGLLTEERFSFHGAHYTLEDKGGCNGLALDAKNGILFAACARSGNPPADPPQPQMVATCESGRAR